MRVGILVSHPIQYYSPWFRALAQRLDLRVFYAHKPTAAQQGHGFGQQFEWDVDLLSGYDYTFLTNRSTNPGTHHFFGCDSPEIAGLIGANPFDAFIVCGWFLKSYWQAVRACRRRKMPVLVRADSIINPSHPRFRKEAKRVIYRWVLRQFDGFLSSGSRNAEYLLHHGVPTDCIFFTPHFVDNNFFALRAAAERQNRPATRTGLGACSNTTIALFVGKLIPKKRPLDILRALQLIRGNGGDFLAVFVGTGELGPSLQRFATDHDIPARFEGFRNQTELPKFYVSADVLILPSNADETWGLVVNEAMACGLPAIVSDAVGCAPDLIDSGRTGFIFPVGDVKALADRLSEIDVSKSSGFDFGPATRKQVAGYSVEKATVALLKAIETVQPRA